MLALLAKKKDPAVSGDPAPYVPLPQLLACHMGHSPSSKVCRFWIAKGKFGGLGSPSGKFHPVDVTRTETEP